MPINPQEFEPKNSRWEDIYSVLEDAGIKVKSPTTKIGVVNEPLVFVTNSGVMQHGTFSTDDYGYELVICVPESQYSKLEPLVVRVREVMKQLYPMIVDDRNVSTSMFDDTMRAHYVTASYTNHRKFSNY